MSVLVVGVSHKTAPVAVLERLALTPDGVGKLIADVAAIEHVTEVTALATCNRIEVYAEVDRFHGSVEEVSRLLCERSGMATSDITSDLLPHLYVHYDDGAVSHLFHVAAGLDSMVVGEGQILGQARDALRTGQELGTVGPALNSLFQQALRVGKRSHAETDIDRAAPSMVSAALDRAVAAVGPVTGSRVLVIGAGAMASLAVATASRRGAADITVVNRTETNAERLADEYAARSLPLSSLADALGNADIVISCTGATGIVVTADELSAARGSSVRPVAVLDLALPHDVDPAAAELPDVTLIDLRVLADELRDSDAGREVLGVRQIVGQEISAFVSARRQASVTPTVVALRTMATGVVDTEIERLFSRLPDLDEAARAEVLHAVRRVADKLLHQPTVRVKELANSDGAVSYAAALAELFALDPDAVDAVTRPVTPTSPTDLATTDPSGVPVSELPPTVEETQP
jgi:glutamyl-tRNA reductase